MLGRYHVDITRQAIGAEASSRAIKVILRANLGQYSLQNQFGRDHFHFDHMNHDGLHVSAEWDYVFQASVRRTRLEFDGTVSQLSPAHLSSFTDR